LSDAQPITGCCPGDIAPNLFLCGDPARVERIAADWDDAREVCKVREYTILTGSKAGVALSVASHGIGAPSTAVLIEEMIKLGASTMIRIGNSGGLDPGLEIGDLAISTGCVRDDGTSKSYVIAEYPAVASFEIVTALVGASKALGVRAHAGVTWSLDAFYARNAIAGPDDVEHVRWRLLAKLLRSPHSRHAAGQGAQLRDGGRGAAHPGRTLRRPCRRDLRRLGSSALARTLRVGPRPQYDELHRGGNQRHARSRYSGINATGIGMMFQVRTLRLSLRL